MSRPSFDDCINMIRDANQLIYEDGYHWIQDYLVQHIDKLIELTVHEQNSDIRAKFVELSGDSKMPKVIPYLQEELRHPEREVRYWAYLSLEYFGISEATKVAEDFKHLNPHEDFL